MHVPPGAEKFTFPNPLRPSSPPPTPSQSPQSSISHISPIFSKRNGFIRLAHSPPEHLDPTGKGFEFSYTPPPRQSCWDSSSGPDDEEASLDEHAEPEVESRSEATTPLRHRAVYVQNVDEQTDITVEEISENDMGYDSDTEAVQPDYIEDADSESGWPRTPEVDHSLAHQLNGLHCDESPGRRAFEETQRHLREKKMKRWSKGGSNKRSHAESIGMDSDSDDMRELDAHEVGSSARRLRRRTEGPADRPRTSLLFDDPPKELEELKDVTDGSGGTNSESPLPIHSQEQVEHDQGLMDVETTITSTDEDDVPLPYWRYPMEIDSDPSRPPSSYAQRH